MQARLLLLSLGLHCVLLAGAGWLLGGSGHVPRKELHLRAALPAPPAPPESPSPPPESVEAADADPGAPLAEPVLPFRADDLRDLLPLPRPSPSRSRPMEAAHWRQGVTRPPEVESAPEPPTPEAAPAAPPPAELVRARFLDGVNAAPAYPLLARRRGLEGTVVLAVDIASDGTVAAAELLRSSGHAVLDDAALQAARDWRFAPAKRGSVPVPDRIEKTVRFELR